MSLDEIVFYDVNLPDDRLEVVLFHLWKRRKRVFEAVDNLSIQAAIISRRLIFEAVSQAIGETKDVFVLVLWSAINHKRL